MADTGRDTKSDSGPLSSLRTAAKNNPVTERLFSEAEDYVSAKVQNLVSSAGNKLGETTKKLTEAAEGDGLGSLVTEGGKKLAEGKNPARVAMEVGAKGIKDKVMGALTGGGGGGGSGTKFNNIVEDVDVGVPVRTAFDQWVNYQDYGDFTRGVLSVDQVDEVTTNWNAKVAKSKRSWKATVSEQIPDQRIVWNTEGAKGTIRGVVTFHPLGENLTRVLLVIEYYPSGFFEKTANMWWAASRRVRLDLKHYRRFIMMEGEASDEGWRGTIRDGEVVQSHEEAIEAEQAEQEEQATDGDEDGHERSEDEESEYEDEDSEYDEDEEPEDLDDEEAYEDEDEDEDEDEQADDEDAEDEGDETSAEDEDFDDEDLQDEDLDDEEAEDDEDLDDEEAEEEAEDDSDEEAAADEDEEQDESPRTRRPRRPRRPSRASA